MTLWTLDEAREAVVTSATALLTEARCHTAACCFLLWGAGAVEGINEVDRALGRRHRAVLDNMIALGYESEAVEELEGIASAVGLDQDDYDPGDRTPPWSWSPRPSF